MLLHRLESWHVPKLFFHRLLTEVSSCVYVSIYGLCVNECGCPCYVVEVAHDIQAQVSKYVRETLGLVNSYNTWHGTVVFLVVYKCIMLL